MSDVPGLLSDPEKSRLRSSPISKTDAVAELKKAGIIDKGNDSEEVDSAVAAIKTGVEKKFRSWTDACRTP